MATDIDQAAKDADTIFTTISTGDFDDYTQAQQAVVTFYVADLSFSRSGITQALNRLKLFYEEKLSAKLEENGIVAIIFLQNMIGETENEESAREGWSTMTLEERMATMHFYNSITEYKNVDTEPH